MPPDGGRRAAEIERLVADLDADLQALDRLAVDCVAQREVLADAPDNRGAASILALGMHGYYTAVESIIERSERVLATPPAPGPNWHKDLLQGATRPLGNARPAILSEVAARHLDKLRAFRHFIRHAYTVDLDTAELEHTVRHLATVHPILRHDLAEFSRQLRQMVALLNDEA